MAEPGRWPPGECMAVVPNEGRVAAGQLGGEFTGWRSGRSVAVLDGDERPARDGAGEEEGEIRGPLCNFCE